MTDANNVEKFGKVDDSWVLVGVGSLFYLGRQVDASWSRAGKDDTEKSGDVEGGDEEDDSLYLAPCYRIHTERMQARPNEVIDVPQCQPYGVGMLAYTTKVLLAHYDTLVEVGDLEEMDRRALVELVNQAEGVKQNLRAHRAKLVLPGGNGALLRA